MPFDLLSGSRDIGALWELMKKNNGVIINTRQNLTKRNKKLTQKNNDIVNLTCSWQHSCQALVIISKQLRSQQFFFFGGGVVKMVK